MKGFRDVYIGIPAPKKKWGGVGGLSTKCYYYYVFFWNGSKSSSKSEILGGGFTQSFIFTPILGEDEFPFWRAFFKWVRFKPPTIEENKQTHAVPHTTTINHYSWSIGSTSNSENGFSPFFRWGFSDVQMKKNAKLFRAMTELAGSSVVTRFVGRSHESNPQKLGKIYQGEHVISKGLLELLTFFFKSHCIFLKSQMILFFS